MRYKIARQKLNKKLQLGYYIFINFGFYPTALKSYWGFVFTNAVRMAGRAGGWKCLSGMYLRNCMV